MADERNEWLDHEAAERLLRGEPVDAGDDYTRWQAERLSRALDSARGVPLAAGPSGELPGEEAALTAFRAARAERAAAPRAGAGSDLGSVRIGGAPRPARPTGLRGWLRPARWGLAASVAGLAVGGVAVAASTGVLPAFGGRTAPGPASSVAAPAKPPVPAAPTDAPGDSTGPGSPASPGGTPAITSPPPSARDGGATAGGGAPDDNDGASPGRTEADWGRAATRAPDGTWSAAVTQACRDLRDGRLDAARRHHLEHAAKSSGGAQRFCDQVLAGGGHRHSAGTSSTGTGTSSGSGSSSGSGESAGKGADTGKDSGKGESGKGGDGTGDRGSGDPEREPAKPPKAGSEPKSKPGKPAKPAKRSVPAKPSDTRQHTSAARPAPPATPR
ncbi:extensin [Streptomyces fradiae]|uniref:extensin n=1 Tax=Streptomyces fradiae TaxID=1906 RepID=UPI00398736BA